MLYLTRLPGPTGGCSFDDAAAGARRHTPPDSNRRARPAAACVLGCGLYLILTSLPFGRGQSATLANDSVGWTLTSASACWSSVSTARQRLFTVRLLDDMLRPIVEDVGRRAGPSSYVWGSVAAASGDAPAHHRPGVDGAQFMGEKVAAGVIVAAMFPLMNLLHIHPFGA